MTCRSAWSWAPAHTSRCILTPRRSPSCGSGASKSRRCRRTRPSAATASSTLDVRRPRCTSPADGRVRAREQRLRERPADPESRQLRRRGRLAAVSLDERAQAGRSLALVVDDPDAPSGVFTHWVAWGQLLGSPARRLTRGVRTRSNRRRFPPGGSDACLTMTRWSAITRTRGRRSALAYGSRSTTAAEDNLNRLVHHQRGRYCQRPLGAGGRRRAWRQLRVAADLVAAGPARSR